MSQAETMRLIAELVDKTSIPLGEIKKAATAMSKGLTAAQAEAGKAAREHAKHMHELHERFRKAKEFIGGAFTPALASMGITAFGVGEIIGKMGDKLKEAAEQYNKFSDTVKRGHVSVGYVQTLQNTFEQFGIDAERANGAIQQMGRVFDQLKRGTNSAVRQELQNVAPNFLPMVEDILRSSKDYEQAMDRIITSAKKMNLPTDQQDRIFGALNIPTEVSTKTLEEYETEKKIAAERAKNHPQNLERLHQLDEAYVRLRAAQKDFWTDMTNTFGPAASRILGLVTQDIETYGRKIKEIWEWFKSKQDGAPADDNKSLERNNWKGKKGGFQWRNPFAAHDAQDLKEGIRPISFGGSADGPDKVIRNGVKEGVLDAFREWMGLSSKRGAGGFQNASFSPSNDNVGGGGRGWGNSEFKQLPNGGGGGGGGGFKSARTGIAKRAMIDQLRKEGVPEQHLEAAASMLTGQAIAESGLNPNTKHDGGSGYGIYGARGPRAHGMLNWLKANGYATNDLEGQSRYMAHEAMTGRGYAASRNALMNATRENMAHGTRVLTHNFESPAVENWGRRLRDSMSAFNARSGAHLSDMVHRGHIAGSNAAKGVGTIGNPNMAGLNPEFAARLHSLWAAAPDSAKRGAGVISGARSSELQAELYRRYRSGRGGLAARPGHSKHEQGLAADWRDPSGWFHQHAHEHGLAFPLGHRDWPHMQMDPRFDGSLLKHHRQNQPKISGDASVSIDLNGFPKGTRTSARSSGVFKEVRLNRGRPMGMASQDA